MNQAIIFSKNRPLQLEALLSSIDYNAPKFDRIVVIYKSDDYFLSGYERLKNTWRINWHRQTGFKADVLANMPDNGTTTFFVDDDIFYKKYNVENPWDIISNNRNVFKYSLRLGLNVNKSYVLGKDIKIPEPVNQIGDVFLYEIKSSDDEFKYEFSLDGDCFKNEDIKWFMQEREYDCPNQFEGEMTQIRAFLKPFSMCACNEKSNIVNVPHNKVQNYSDTTSMGKSEFELMDKFNLGLHIDWMSMDFSKVNSPHMELEYKFR